MTKPKIDRNDDGVKNVLSLSGRKNGWETDDLYGLFNSRTVPDTSDEEERYHVFDEYGLCRVIGLNDDTIIGYNVFEKFISENKKFDLPLTHQE